MESEKRKASKDKYAQSVKGIAARARADEKRRKGTPRAVKPSAGPAPVPAVRFSPLTGKIQTKKDESAKVGEFDTVDGLLRAFRRDTNPLSVTRDNAPVQTYPQGLAMAIDEKGNVHPDAAMTDGKGHVSGETVKQLTGVQHGPPTLGGALDKIHKTKKDKDRKGVI